MDLLHRAMKWIDYNRGLSTALILVVCVAVGIAGCQPKTASIVDPEVKVTASQLQQEILSEEARLTGELATLEAELAVLDARADAAIEDIEAQINLRQDALQVLGGLGTSIGSGDFNPASVVGSIVSLGLLLTTGGVGFDNVRKRRVIKDLKNGSG